MISKHSMTGRSVAGGLLLVFLFSLTGCGWGAKPNGQDTKPTSKAETLFSLGLAQKAFAQETGQDETVTPSIPAYKIAASDISNLSAFAKAEIALTPQQLKKLEEPGFFLADSVKKDADWPYRDDFIDMYSDIQGSSAASMREPQDTVFITSDYALHLYHVLVDRSFQKIEEDKFQPLLFRMTKTLLLDALDKYQNTAEGKMKDSYGRIATYFLVPYSILSSATSTADSGLDPAKFEDYAKYIEANEKKMQEANGTFEIRLAKEIGGRAVPEEIVVLAGAELDLVKAAKGLGESPLFTRWRPDFKNDYSQFKPRSHYTKNSILKSYFVAMMWYGRMGFTVKSPELTRDALIITGQINTLKDGNDRIADLWSGLSSVIDFFVGETDDLTAFQYTQLAGKIWGGGISSAIADDQAVQEFSSAAVRDLPTPRILSEALNIPGADSISKEDLLKDTLQFRFMGQRFTPDAYMLNRLTQGDESPDPETGQKLPSMPTALMPISLLAPDNSTIKGYLDSWVSANAPNSDKIIAKRWNELKNEIGAYTAEYWNSNIYLGWLNTLRPLLTEYGTGYPSFMIGAAWQKKNLGTVLGSYTELKHDTLLYAKQSYAELGGGGPDEKMPPAVKGYVEPDLVFWNRLSNLVNVTKNGLSQRGLMPEVFSERFTSLANTLDFLKKIVKQELKNEKISDVDFEKLRTLTSSVLADLVAPLPGEELTIKEKRAGIIADIHTDAVKMQILYEATGQPYVVFVAVKDANGTRLTRGLVYRHYELTNPLDTRLSDEDWQDKAYLGNSQMPPEDQWSRELVK